MKKLLITILFSAVSLFGLTQNLFTYQINAKVILSNGDSIPTGAVCVLIAHVEQVSLTGKINYDIHWYYSLNAKTKSWDNVIASKSSSDRTGTRLTSWSQSVADPTLLSYTVMQNAIKAYLETIYGVGNVVVIP